MRFGGIVAALAALWIATPLQAAWLEVRSPHFIIYSEGSPDAARKFAKNLERFDKAVRKLLAFPDVEGNDPNPVTVFLVDSVSQISDLCKGGNEPADKAKAGKQCRWVAGFYRARAAGSVAFVPRMAGSGPLSLDATTILFHEYAHHLMLANSGAAYPAWYVEGFAEFVSNAKLDQKGVVGIGLPANSRASALYAEAAMPVRDLLTANPSTLGSTETSIFYARAWLLTHYLTFATTRDRQLTRYLEAINAGKSSAAAADETFGDLHALNREVEAYLRRNRFASLSVPVTDIAPDALRIRQLSPGEDAMMKVRLQSQRSVNSETAPAVAAEARRIAAAYPTDTGAQVALAEAEDDAGNFDAAEAAADRAVAAEPNNRHALILKAMAIMHRASHDNQFDDVTWRTARRLLVKANQIEPDAAWPLALFYRSFREQGRDPTGSAVAALERAATLVPQDASLRMMLVSQYLHDHKYEEARIVLMPLAFDPHAPADNPARKLLEAIDKRGANGLSGAALLNIDLSSDDETKPESRNDQHSPSGPPLFPANRFH